MFSTPGDLARLAVELDDVHGVRTLRQNGPVTPRQLVLRGPERKTAALDLVNNATGAPPTSFEDPEHGVRVPKFGGAALLRAADRALHEGYSVRRFEFAGAGQSSLADVDAEEVSDEVVDALLEQGPAGAQGLLRHLYRTFIVEGVEFYSQATRSVTLRRDGVIFGTTDEALWIFIHGVLEEVRAS